MKFFKKNGKTVGKGAEETAIIHKEFDVLNYTPVDYKYTEKYLKFLQSSDKDFHEMIEKIKIDDLCDDLLDYYIDANINEMKASAKEQFTHHLDVINHHKGVLEGQIKSANEHLNLLKKDLEETEEEISALKRLKKDKNIY